MGNCMLGSMCLKPESVDNTKMLTSTQTPTDQIKKAELFQGLDKPGSTASKTAKPSPRESKQSTDKKKYAPQLVKDSVDSGSEDAEHQSVKEIVEEILTDKKAHTAIPVKFRSQHKTNSRSDQNVMMKTHISSGDVVDFSSFRDGQHEIFTSEVPTSFGKIRLDNNSIYEGEWLRGQRNGYGVMTWPNGVRFEGHWENNMAKGKGKLVLGEDEYLEYYDGYWDKDKANGFGEYNYKNELIFKGDWVEDLQHGQGTEMWKDGTTYSGSFVNGLKHGQGKMVFPGKGVYEGEFKNGYIEGNGTFNFKNGTVYTGEWKNNMMEGKGSLTYTNKKEYSGEFKRGVRWGTGTLKWPDGRKYEGGWKEDKQNNQQHTLLTIHWTNNTHY